MSITEVQTITAKIVAILWTVPMPFHSFLPATLQLENHLPENSWCSATTKLPSSVDIIKCH